VDILKLLGLLRLKPVPGYEEAEDMAWRFSIWVHELTGIPVWQLVATIVRLAEGQGLEGYPPGSLCEAYFGQPRLELSHVAVALHELDRDGTTARLWGKLCHRWPIFREYHAQLDAEALGKAPGDAATDTNPSEPVAEARPATVPAIDLESQALALLFKEPELSITQIAERLGVDRKTPYGWPKFREAAELKGSLRPRGLRDRSPRRGHKSGGRVEAYDDANEDMAEG
jgi:hypothetical protein